MKPTDYQIHFIRGSYIRVPKEVAENLKFDEVFLVNGKPHFFARAEILCIVPVGGEEGVIEPKTPQQVKAAKSAKEDKIVNQIYGIEEKAMS